MKPETWLLDELKLLKFSHICASVQELDNENSEMPEVPVDASPEVVNLVSSQLEQIPEVALKIYFLVKWRSKHSL
jgi:hypothetical protein